MKASQYCQELAKKVFSFLKENEYLTMDFTGETSQFVRFNQAKIRQLGTVEDLLVNFKFVLEDKVNKQHKKLNIAITLTYNLNTDLMRAKHTIDTFRKEISSMPSDPFIKIPENAGSSEAIFTGKLLSPTSSIDEIFPTLQGIDFTGIYASGTMLRGNFNSLGQSHWFSTDNFTIDYSLYNKAEKSVKKYYAGKNWNQKDFLSQVEEAQQQLTIMDRATKKIERKAYRTYLAPDAVADLIQMFSYETISEAAIRQAHSPIRLLRSNEKSMSPLFSLNEDFRTGDVPQFNSDGEMAPQNIPLIAKGKLVGSLVNSRSAKEYNTISNAADSSESLRSPVMEAGSLREKDILDMLDTGLYLSNLNYLNWSDQHGGRITGLTRYACFWVEGGKIIAPIETMRFDDTIFRLFGSELEALTDKAQFIPITSTYGFRDLGGYRCPGMLVKAMQFTL